MDSNFRNKLRRLFWQLRPIDLAAKLELLRENNFTVESDIIHLKETAAWICRAQDHTPDGGVARAYKVAKYAGYGPLGWQGSYPETTGYIIPTMFALAEVFQEDQFQERAFRMADWEIEIQLDSGAVMGSVVTAPPSPAVFNTGQVIFGWLAAYKGNDREKYLSAALKAGDFLISVQEENGSWKKGNSQYALHQATIYNTRVAWALIELGLEAGNEHYVEVGKRNIEFALSKQRDNGWFSDNCLDDPENPLLHTVVYATRGILESGIVLGREDYIKAAQNTLDRLMEVQREDGGIPGRLNRDWESTVRWDCVTGNAQAAVSWLRLYAINKMEEYKVSARRAIDFVKKTQNLNHRHGGIRGGVKGSFPFDGNYGQFEMLNWAAKFFCDALIMINNPELARHGIKG